MPQALGAREGKGGDAMSQETDHIPRPTDSEECTSCGQTVEMGAKLLEWTPRGRDGVVALCEFCQGISGAEYGRLELGDILQGLSRVWHVLQSKKEGR